MPRSESTRDLLSRRRKIQIQILRGACPELEEDAQTSESRSFAALRMTAAERRAQDDGAGSNADDLPEVVEVPVPVVQCGVVLQHERRDPDVVGRDRGPLEP